MKSVRGLRWYILGLVMLGTVVNYIDRNTLGVLAPILKEQLNFTTVSIRSLLRRSKSPMP